jgi:heat shock protein HslJ
LEPSSTDLKEDSNVSQEQDKVFSSRINNTDSVASFYAMSYTDIVNKYWKLKIIEGQEVQMAENQEREQYFILTIDGAIKGFSGCNYFNGSYTLEEGNRIRIHENLAITKKYCPELAVKEDEYLEVLRLADNFTIYADTLSLHVGKRASFAIFEAVYF